MDAITIHGIRAAGRHGANPGERDVAQPFDIDVTLYVDLHVAERSDALEDTIDYAAVQSRIARVVSETSFALIERLAGAVLESVFSDARIRSASVCISKPRVLDGATPSVRLDRRNPAIVAPD